MMSDASHWSECSACVRLIIVRLSFGWEQITLLLDGGEEKCTISVTKTHPYGFFKK